MRYLFILAALLAHWSLPLKAHEFWVEPLSFQVEIDGEVALDLKVGEMLEGQSYPYLSHKFGRYQITDAAGVHNLIADEGDIPSVVYDATVPGLHVIAYHALPEPLTYDALQDFADFLNEEGLGYVMDRHLARGLPETGFTEAYSRHAKALIQVGPPVAGSADQPTGMAYELVALRNPYLPGDRLPVQLLWQGTAVPDAQVAVFHRSGATVTRTTYLTDAQGIADIPLSGDGTYLLSSVRMEETPPDSGAAWHSIWASLTFAIEQEVAP